jgi:GNAT superfamily N-acetyltransferase
MSDATTAQRNAASAPAGEPAVSSGEPPARAGEPPAPARAWRVRRADVGDAAAVADAVAELLAELGGTPPDAAAMLESARTLLADRDAGAIFVADAGDSLVGVLATSWQSAIHVPGRYALIQDLWVHPSSRGEAIGAALLAALFALADDAGVTRVEVGLPRESFAAIAATTRFYERNGFSPLGPRMRRTLP